MKHQLLLICLFITMQQVSAQTISRYVIATYGSEYKDSNIQVSATIGETFTYTLNNNNITATQGFQQPDDVPGGGNVAVNLKLFLHGYYDNNGLMQKVLYNQGEVSDPTSALADSVTVELHRSVPIFDSVTIMFTITGPCVDNIGSTGNGTSAGLPANASDQYACNFANGILPTLPLGTSFYTDGLLTVTNLNTAVAGSYASEVRMNIFGGASPVGANLYSPGLDGNPTNGGSSNFTYSRIIPPAQLSTIFSSLSGGSSLKLGYWESYNDNYSLSDMGINAGGTSVAKLKIYYQNTNPYSMIRTTKALLHTNGTLTCSFPDSVLGTPYYIVIHHRNTIETWSAAPMTITPDMTYDFTTAASKAYANNQVDVSGNGTIWAMFTADINQDQNVDLLDMPILEDDIALYTYGYTATDLNGDGNTDLLDVIYLDYGIANYVFSYHP